MEVHERLLCGIKAQQTPVYLGFYVLYLHDEDFQLLGLNQNKSENQPRRSLSF